MNIGEHLRRPANSYEGPRTSTKIPEVLRRSLNDFEDLRRSTKPFDYACGHVAFITDIMDTFLGHIRHPRSPTKSCEVPRSISEYLCAGFGASPRPRTIPQYLGIVPFDHRTFLAAFRAVFGSSVMLVAACVHYRLHWDAGVYIVEYQYPGLSVARPFLLS
jgi:hypothetical protein